jgi:hypothetical protein
MTANITMPSTVYHQVALTPRASPRSPTRSAPELT